MLGRPAASESAPYFSTYINQVPGEDSLRILETQLEPALRFFAEISEEKSLCRYSPGKWSLRQALNHVTDTERAFTFRALWFARGFDTPLPSFDQDIAANGAEADRIPWARHIEEFRWVRLSTIALFRNIPAEAWLRGGMAGDNPFTVRALAFITAGHYAHHLRIIRERYL